MNACAIFVLAPFVSAERKPATEDGSNVRRIRHDVRCSHKMREPTSPIPRFARDGFDSDGGGGAASAGFPRGVGLRGGTQPNVAPSMSAQAQKREIHKLFRLRGLSLRPQAQSALLEFIAGQDEDGYEPPETLALILDALGGLGTDSGVVDGALIGKATQQVREERDHTYAERPPMTEVVDLFSVAKHRYHSGRKQFEPAIRECSACVFAWRGRGGGGACCPKPAPPPCRSCSCCWSCVLC